MSISQYLVMYKYTVYIYIYICEAMGFSPDSEAMGFLLLNSNNNELPVVLGAGVFSSKRGHHMGGAKQAPQCL